MKQPSWRRHKKDRKAQSVMEFAISVPVLLLIAFGAIELGQVYQTKIVIVNATREGARYLIYHPDDASFSFTGTLAAVKAEAVNSGVTITNSDILVSCVNLDAFTDKCDRVNPVSVTVSLTYKLGLLGIFKSTIELKDSARMMVP